MSSKLRKGKKATRNMVENKKQCVCAFVYVCVWLSLCVCACLRERERGGGREKGRKVSATFTLDALL